MKIQGKQLYVFMQCTCIDINMAELRESGESMQFLKVIEHANARLTIKEATEPPTFVQNHLNKKKCTYVLYKLIPIKLCCVQGL
jgi:glutaredoxin-related protein